MLERTGWIDDTWYTEESSERGTAVHGLTAAYDLGALELKTCVSLYRGWLLGHVACVRHLRPTWLEIEEPSIHPEYLFGGRPDRVCVVFRTKTILEQKTGGKDKSHGIQTALQAILASAKHGLPPECWDRRVEYIRDNGKYKVEPHDKRADFDEAYRIIKRCC
jgi:hypothetical protein